tara:strand:+ start:193 stop:771 length:579 start_codon:yes stop_codon:yes gene_type:complete
MLIHGNGKQLPKEIDPKNNICLVVSHLDGSKDWWYGSNLVTNDGDIFYAKQAASETPASNENFYASACVLQNPASADTIAKTDAYGQVSSPITTTGAVRPLTATYPKTADADSDNTGASTDAISYRFDWATNQIDTSAGNPITGGAIYDVGQTSPVSATKILTHWNFTSPATFHKTSTDTLKLFVNHTFNGV